MPAAVSDDKPVAVVLNYLTALQLLTRAAGLRRGQTVFVYGVRGGIGSPMVEIGHELGIAVHGTAHGSRLADAPGGVRLFDRDAPHLAGTVRAFAPEAYDAVLDPVGGASRSRSWRLLGPRGTLVMFGAASAAQNGPPLLAHAGTMLRLGMLKLRSGSRRVAMYLFLPAKVKDPDH